MLQPVAWDRWSLVIIYPKPSRCSIGLPHEGAYHVCKSCLPILRIRIAMASGVRVVDRCLKGRL